MKPIIELATMGLCIGFSATSDAVAQTTKDLVGTWTLVSNVNVRQDGSRANVFGPHGKGIAIFESNGRFAIVSINPEMPKFGSNNRAQGTARKTRQPCWEA